MSLFKASAITCTTLVTFYSVFFLCFQFVFLLNFFYNSLFSLLCWQVKQALTEEFGRGVSVLYMAIHLCFCLVFAHIYMYEWVTYPSKRTEMVVIVKVAHCNNEARQMVAQE